MHSFTPVRFILMSRSVRLFFATVLWATLGLAAGVPHTAVTQPVDTITVSPDGPTSTIGAAVEQAEPGDRIVVTSGTYREPTINVRKPLTIVGKGQPVIDGNEKKKTLLHVQADDVTLRGLTLKNVPTSFVNDLAAIKVEKSQDCLIEDNRIEEGFFAIWIGKSEGCRIADNSIQAHKESESYAGNGIHLWYCKNMTVENNTIKGHRDGIYFEFVEESHIEGNHSEDNLRYGLHFMYSDHCRYEDNLFRDNGAGVAVMYTEYVEMVDNHFVRNWGSAAYGLLLKDIYDSVVTGNTFEKNTIGIYSENSTRVEVDSNLFRRNGWGVRVMANSRKNVFTRNNFYGNSFDVTTNSQQNPNTFQGNYWDKYNGYDLDRDGVGDVPYRPVRLFAYLVEQNEPSVLMMRSLFVQILDAAERVIPTITPKTLVDERPAMHRIPLDQ
jgi:nitrous oxidase accessory protein